jgi:hypothetical protein
VPVIYDHDARGPFILRIDFSQPPTPEEKAALVAFMAERREAFSRLDTQLGIKTRRKNTKASAVAATERARREAELVRQILAAAAKLRRTHPDWSKRSIALNLTSQFDLKADTIARKLSPLKKPR